LARRRGPGKLELIDAYLDLALAKHPLKAVMQDLLVHQLCRQIALQPLTKAEVAGYLAIESPGAPCGFRRELLNFEIPDIDGRAEAVAVD